jgi:hypothetical protein
MERKGPAGIRGPFDFDRGSIYPELTDYCKLDLQLQKEWSIMTEGLEKTQRFFQS